MVFLIQIRTFKHCHSEHSEESSFIVALLWILRYVQNDRLATRMDTSLQGIYFEVLKSLNDRFYITIRPQMPAAIVIFLAHPAK